MRKLEAMYEVRATYSYFPLHPDTPPEGLSLEELFAGREAQLGESKARLTELMRLEGLPYGDRTHTYNSRLAQELALWADGLGATDAMHDALFDAYFVRAANLADMEVLAGIAETAGLDPVEARTVVQDRSYSDSIDAHWREAMQMGITGVPTFVAGRYGVVGAQPYETLEALMREVGVGLRDD